MRRGWVQNTVFKRHVRLASVPALRWVFWNRRKVHYRRGDAIDNKIVVRALQKSVIWSRSWNCNSAAYRSNWPLRIANKYRRLVIHARKLHPWAKPWSEGFEICIVCVAPVSVRVWCATVIAYYWQPHRKPTCKSLRTFFPRTLGWNWNANHENDGIRGITGSTGSGAVWGGDGGNGLMSIISGSMSAAKSICKTQRHKHMIHFKLNKMA